MGRLTSIHAAALLAMALFFPLPASAAKSTSVEALQSCMSALEALQENRPAAPPKTAPNTDHAKYKAALKKWENALKKRQAMCRKLQANLPAKTGKRQ